MKILMVLYVDVCNVSARFFSVGTCWCFLCLALSRVLAATCKPRRHALYRRSSFKYQGSPLSILHWFLVAERNNLLSLSTFDSTQAVSQGRVFSWPPDLGPRGKSNFLSNFFLVRSTLLVVPQKQQGSRNRSNRTASFFII